MSCLSHRVSCAKTSRRGTLFVRTILHQCLRFRSLTYLGDSRRTRRGVKIHQQPPLLSISKEMMSSKPIPIPPCKADHYRNDDDDEEIAHEAQMYDAKTWRMYHRIFQSRLIRATYFMTTQPNLYLVDPSQHHLVLMQENDHSTTSTPSSPEQRDDTHQDREHSQPEPPFLPRRSSLMDEVFIMD